MFLLFQLYVIFNLMSFIKSVVKYNERFENNIGINPGSKFGCPLSVFMTVLLGKKIS